MPNMMVRRRVVGMHGLGDAATCPSLEQLQGINDPTDPCQSPVAPGSCPSGTTASFTQGALGTGSSWVCVNNSTGTNVVTGTPVATTALVSSASSIPTSYLMVGLLALAALMVLRK